MNCRSGSLLAIPSRICTPRHRPPICRSTQALHVKQTASEWQAGQRSIDRQKQHHVVFPASHGENQGLRLKSAMTSSQRQPPKPAKPKAHRDPSPETKHKPTSSDNKNPNCMFPARFRNVLWEGGETADWMRRGIDFRTRCRYARPLIRLRLGEARLPSALPALFPPHAGPSREPKASTLRLQLLPLWLNFLFFPNGMLTAGRWHADVSLKLRAGGQAVRFRKKVPQKVCEQSLCRRHYYLMRT